MTRFHLLTAVGAASIGLAACSYDSGRADDQQDVTANGAEASAEGGMRVTTPVGNLTVPDGSRIVIEPGGARVRIDPDGTRVRIGADGAEIRVKDGEIDASVRTGEDSQVSVQTNRR